MLGATNGKGETLCFVQNDNIKSKLHLIQQLRKL